MISLRKTNLFTLLLGAMIGWSASVAPVFQTSVAQESETKVAVGPDSKVATDKVAADDIAGDAERPLETLDWMIGSWSEDSADPKIKFSCNFTKNNAFMIRSFKSIKADAGMSGMQVVAWDPAKQQLRSWTFDSDGGFGHGVWSQSGDRYTIRTTYTLPDGGIGAAINVVTFVDSDTFTFRSINREIDGVLQPDIEEVTLVRADARQEQQPIAPPATDANQTTQSNGDNQ